MATKFPQGHPWAKKSPDPPYDPCLEWLTIPQGKFYLTVAYLQGARQGFKNQQAAWRDHLADPAVPYATTFGRYPASNPYAPGPAFAQYNWGYANQICGAHSNFQELFVEPAESTPSF